MKDITITKALTQHHNEMRNLIEEIKKDESKYILLKKHLDIHHELEEDLLLSLLNTNKDVNAESLESKEEHYVLNMLLLDLADFPKDNPRWMIKFKVFVEIVEHHLSEEEEDLFPEAEEHLPASQQKQLGEEFLHLKQQRLSIVMETK
ncbi:hemerythrin domain-containing protein [uncultured Draconibacterium sp.]|uniref:hemerythrin domain-containing protein n=1 Tax=uncultured Draconibacterium sp. TaxID=1573823 RepID=UPI0029C69CDE|nr:hemerythrin domain-containing protein [uncultured Draconibacterium sp.]